MARQSQVLEDLARSIHNTRTSRANSAKLVDLSTVIMHAKIAMIGHTHGLTKSVQMGQEEVLSDSEGTCVELAEPRATTARPSPADEFRQSSYAGGPEDGASTSRLAKRAVNGLTVH